MWWAVLHSQRMPCEAKRLLAAVSSTTLLKVAFERLAPECAHCVWAPTPEVPCRFRLVIL